MLGRAGVEKAFGLTFADRFDIHRTRRGFPLDDYDTFGSMAGRGVRVVDRAVREEMGGAIDHGRDEWIIRRVD
jgi:hypothetical protein